MIDADDLDNETYIKMTFQVKGEDEMRTLASAFAEVVSPEHFEDSLYEDCYKIGLRGDIGAGKSTFVKGFVSHFNDAVLYHDADYNQKIWLSDVAGCITSLDAYQYDETLLSAAADHDCDHSFQLIEHPDHFDDPECHVVISVENGKAYDERMVTIYCDAALAESKQLKELQKNSFALTPKPGL